MYNKFRSKAFLKIKHNIFASRNEQHLETCFRMIELASPITTRDEQVILREYYNEALNNLTPLKCQN